MPEISLDSVAGTIYRGSAFVGALVKKDSVMSSAEIEAAVGPHRHLVQFYGANDLPLTRNVGAYLARGLSSGNSALVVASEEHRTAFLERLAGTAIDSKAAVESGRFLLLDAADTLARFMVDGEPHRGRFDEVVGSTIRKMEAEWGGAGMRGYGEMVGILWQQGKRDAAIRLERFWNELLTACGLGIYCAYPIDVLQGGFKLEAIDGVLAAHTMVIESNAPGELANAVLEALDDVLGSRADGLKMLMKSKNFRRTWADLPEGEAIVLWLRHNLPEHAEQVFSQARRYLN